MDSSVSNISNKTIIVSFGNRAHHMLLTEPDLLGYKKSNIFPFNMGKTVSYVLNGSLLRYCKDNSGKHYIIT